MPALTFADDVSNPMPVLPQPQAAIDVRQLSVEFEGRAVLDNIDLSLAAGQIAALLGANGTGKTTLLRCLAGLLRPTSGAVQWFGQCPRRNPAMRRLIGMVAHHSFLYPELTPRENLLFAAQMCDVPDPTARVAHLLIEAGLQRCADQPTARLSNGWRRRVSIARALAHGPRILLLDEPFAGLDEEGQHWLLRLLWDWRDRAVAICLTAHEYPRAWRLTDRVLRLENGKLNDRTREAKDVQIEHHDWADAA